MIKEPFKDFYFFSFFGVVLFLFTVLFVSLFPNEYTPLRNEEIECEVVNGGELMVSNYKDDLNLDTNEYLCYIGKNDFMVVVTNVKGEVVDFRRPLGERFN